MEENGKKNLEEEACYGWDELLLPQQVMETCCLLPKTI
jgi:hypothetical protein